jgi:hypothetical protein
VEIRRLTPGDAAAVLRLCDLAGWNQTEADVLRLLALEPEGCVAACADGRVVGAATTTAYGTALAWVGMVLVDPEFAGQESEFYGGQKVNALFADISTTVDTDWQWLPYMEFAYTSFNETFGAAVAAKGDLSAGLDAWQAQLVEYGTQQGFTVNG